METLLQDVRYGLRMLAKAPGFTILAIVTLALGIGANTAIFSIVNAVLLEPLPFHNPGRLVRLFETEAAPGHYPFTGPDYLDWQRDGRTLEGTSLYTYGNNVSVSGAGQPQQATLVNTEANFFSLLGVQPLLGRTFAKGEDAAGHNQVAVLSYGFWQRQLGGRRDVAGQSIELDGQTYTVIGVMPPWFSFPEATDLWAPQDMSTKALGQRGEHSYPAIGRLKPGATIEQAQAELSTIAARLARQYPDSNHDVGAAVVSLKEQLVGKSRTQILVLLGAVALVLLIACANVANLLLVRATGRHREIALRGALGASRGRLVRQLLTESVMLALVGASFGAGLAWWSVKYFANAEALPLPRPNPIALDGTVLLFTIVIAVLVGLLFGLAPALETSQLHLSEELKASAQAVVSATGHRRWLRDALVVAEIAISLALLVGAGLLLRSFANLRDLNLGIQPQNLVSARVNPPEAKYTTMEARQAFYDQLLRRIENTPGVRATAISSEIPLEGGSNGYIKIPGNDNPAFARILVEWNFITPGYFQTYGIPLIRGRNFSAQDLEDMAETARKIDAMQKSGANSMPPNAGLHGVAVINQTMARTFWPGKNALDKIFNMDGFPVRVVGVAGDVREWGIREPVIPQAYLPVPFALMEGAFPLAVTVRTNAKSAGGIAAMRDAVRGVDPSLAIFRPRTMSEIIAESMAGTTYQTALLAVFAVLALVLAAVGIYGVMSYGVSQRTHEIGVRMAIGASPGAVMKLILGEGLRLVALGLAIGIAGAFALTRSLSSLLYGVGAGDPLTFAGVAVVLAAVALAACAVPARRAMRVDPMLALREE
jgi:putative ABC transport system permease protein